jgi:hypothetical protein
LGTDAIPAFIRENVSFRMGAAPAGAIACDTVVAFGEGGISFRRSDS